MGTNHSCSNVSHAEIKVESAEFTQFNHEGQLFHGSQSRRKMKARTSFSMLSIRK